MSLCTLCPRECGVDRAKTRGACHVGERITLARAALHAGEEPCLSPQKKSGAVFFSGCALGCVFCQNAPISAPRPVGREVTEEEFSAILLRLQNEGAENLDLVTGSHFVPQIARALRAIKADLHVPVVFNCSGYEKPETLASLTGLVDVYLPDFKFSSSALSARLCRAEDYSAVAERALLEMFSQVGPCTFDENGKLLQGLVIRHLILPSHASDSLAVLETLDRLFPNKNDVRLSLLRQFTPMPTCRESDLSRPLTTLEYHRVVRRAAELGFLGYTQEKSSVGHDAIPVFDGEGVK